MNAESTKRKPGRPRSIPEDRIEEVISLYRAGLGYRAIARELMKQGICVDWSTVRRVIKKWRREKGQQNGSCSNCDTILTRGPSED
jgi:transposase-like protein